MSLYYIRHGQTAHNTSHVYGGEIDVELNENGKIQAKEAGKKLEGTKIDIVFCSPLTRTRQTLDGLNLNKNIPVIYDERLVERREGSLVGKTITNEFIHDVYLNLDTTEHYDGLEPIKDAFVRVHALLDEIKEKYKDKNILIVAHAFVGRVVYYYFNPIPADRNLFSDTNSYLANCEIKQFEFNGKESNKSLTEF